MSVGPKWEDILDEAKFHYVVERKPLREGSESWERAVRDGADVPPEMLAWVTAEIGALKAAIELEKEMKANKSNETAMETAKA